MEVVLDISLVWPQTLLLVCAVPWLALCGALPGLSVPLSALLLLFSIYSNLFPPSPC